MMASLSEKLTEQVANAFSYTLEISEQALQKKAEDMMPLTKKKRLFTAVISNPTITLIAETDEIGLLANIEVKTANRLRSMGQINVKGAIDYRPETGDFYIRDAQIVSLDFSKTPMLLDTMIRKTAQKSMDKLLDKTPVYQFNNEDFKHKLGKSVLKKVQVKDQLLLVTLGFFNQKK